MLEVRALSIRQPYVEEIITGRKLFEWRVWTTRYRGPVLLHASLTPADRTGRDLPRGGFVAASLLEDIDDFGTEYGWVFEPVVRLPRLIAYQGRLNLFRVDLSSLKRSDSSVIRAALSEVERLDREYRESASGRRGRTRGPSAKHQGQGERTRAGKQSRTRNNTPKRSSKGSGSTR